MSQATQDKYVMLITSLPRPDELFKASRTPLSRLKLEQRLRVLSPREQNTLQAVEHALDWRFLDATLNDKALLSRDRRAYEQVDNHTLRLIIRNRLEMRTLLAAMRMREQELPPPSEPRWGYGRWQSHIVRHWHDKDFSLSQVFPWLHNALELYHNDQPLSLEKLLLSEAMKQLKRLNHLHLYDFEAVVIYVLKWDLLARSLQMNRYQAKQRFNALIEKNMLACRADLTWGEPHHA